MIDRDTAETYEILFNIGLRLALTAFLLMAFVGTMIFQIVRGFTWPSSALTGVMVYAMKVMFQYYFSHRPPKGQ